MATNPLGNIVSGLNTRYGMSGLSSGMDTDSIVRSMLLTKSASATRMFQNLTMNEWKRDAYVGVNNQLRVFRDKFLSTLSKDSMISPTAYQADKITGNFSKYLSITSSGVKEDVSHDMTVSQLASAAKVEGGTMNALPETQFNRTFADWQTINPGKINMGENAVGDPELRFKINDVEFSFNANDTVNKVLNKINNSAAGVTMSYDAANDRFVMAAKVTGEYNADTNSKAQINIENISGNFFGDPATSYTKIDAIAHRNGTDAMATIDGEAITRSSNTFTYDKLNITLKKVTPAGVTADFEVTRDVDAVVDKIKNFVKEYNDLMDSLNTMVNEKKVKGYLPLTNEQKEGMSDKEIELWEKTAKTGILYRDKDVMDLRDAMRGLFSDKIAGTDYMNSIGISTENYFMSAATGGYSGKIVIDENKLRTALDTDPDKVVKMFTSAVPTVSGNPVTADEYLAYKSAVYKATEQYGGLMQRVTSILDKHTESTRDMNIKFLNESITETTTRLTTEKTRLAKYESSLYAKFAAMEKALSSMQSQSNWLAGQLGGSAQ